MKNARMACDPTETNVSFHEFLMLAARPGACHASKNKAKLKANTLTKNTFKNRWTSKFLGRFFSFWRWSI